MLGTFLYLECNVSTSELVEAFPHRTKMPPSKFGYYLKSAIIHFTDVNAMIAPKSVARPTLVFPLLRQLAI
jgi:hypothetical protein